MSARNAQDRFQTFVMLYIDPMGEDEERSSELVQELLTIFREER